jgi:YjbE family integral membrane protein
MLGLAPPTIAAYLQVIFIDVVLSGDNAVVIGLAAAGLRPDLRRKAIMVGIAAATGIRIGFALAATQLLAITGLLLAGGLLLLWVCWKMYAELREVEDVSAAGDGAGTGRAKTLRQAIVQIVLADVSMSLDNVLAVAGAAREHLSALVFGLVLSVVLMGVAASWIARLLHRFRWIAWIGLAIIAYVALAMIYEGTDQLLAGQLPHLPLLKS